MCGTLFRPKLDNRVTIYYSSRVNWKHFCSSSPEPFCGSISNVGPYKYSILLLYTTTTTTSSYTRLKRISVSITVEPPTCFDEFQPLQSTCSIKPANDSLDYVLVMRFMVARIFCLAMITWNFWKFASFNFLRVHLSKVFRFWFHSLEVPVSVIYETQSWKWFVRSLSARIRAGDKNKTARLMCTHSEFWSGKQITQQKPFSQVNRTTGLDVFFVTDESHAHNLCVYHYVLFLRRYTWWEFLPFYSSIQDPPIEFE